MPLLYEFLCLASRLLVNLGKLCLLPPAHSSDYQHKSRALASLFSPLEILFDKSPRVL